MKRLLRSPLTLLLTFLGFTVLSWVLFFREERVLTALVTFMPAWQPVLLDIRQYLLSVGLNTVPTLLFGVLAVTACAAYLFSLKEEHTRNFTIMYALIFQAVVFFSYPVLSTDIFSYIFSDRVFTEYGQNIWKVTPDTFPDDPYWLLSDWKDQTKVYGMVNQVLYLPASYLGGESLVLTVILYKLTAVAFSVAALLVFVELLKDRLEKQQVQAIKLLFWNPLYVLEIAGSGHNDVAMIFFFLWSLLFYKNKQWWWAGVVLALSVQVKLILAAFFIFAGVALLRQKNWRALVEFGAGVGLVNAAAFWYMQVTPLEFLSRVLYNSSVYWQSLPSLVHRFWENEKVLFTPAVLVMVAVVLLWQWRKKVEPVLATTVFLLLYLLLFSAAYWNWYVLWVLVAVPFIKVKWLQVMIVAFSFTSLLAYPLLWLSLRFGYNHLGWSFVYYGWIFVVPMVLGWLARSRDTAKLL